MPLLPEDLDAVRSFPTALPHLYFFRHKSGLQGVKAGQPFGNRLLYKYWKKACSNLGVDGVDLYGGTKHSSATALRLFRTPEQIKKATMHSTNKAFERYFKIEMDDLRDVYADTQKVSQKITSNKGKIIGLNEK